MLCTLGICVVFIISISLFIQFGILRRIYKLDSAVTEIAISQDFNKRITESGRDEITSLSRSFNFMLVSLESEKRYSSLCFMISSLQ